MPPVIPDLPPVIPDLPPVPDQFLPPWDTFNPTPDMGSGGGCGSITFQGCCAGQILWYCGGGTQLQKTDCTGSPNCGWDSTYQYYACSTAGTADPSGTHPMPCPAGSTPDSGPTPDLFFMTDL